MAGADGAVAAAGPGPVAGQRGVVGAEGAAVEVVRVACTAPDGQRAAGEVVDVFQDVAGGGVGAGLDVGARAQCIWVAASEDGVPIESSQAGISRDPWLRADVHEDPHGQAVGVTCRAR